MESEIPQVERLTAQELARRLEAGDALLLLDVRENVERAHCLIHTSGATQDLHVPIGEVADRLAEVRRAAEGLPLVVYCHHGVRSLAVANWLGRQGLRGIANLEGGIDAWSNQVDPTVARY